MTIPISARWTLTLMVVIAVIALSVVPGKARAGDSLLTLLVAAIPSTVQKVMHFTIYATLAGLCLWSLEDIANSLLQLLIAFALATGIGAALEWYQTQIPGRFGTLSDVALNAAGVIAGLVTAKLLL